ncbi:glycerophosphodiester phosphodiesterase [Nocardioides sp. SYSU DS0651]|uniref:glycerophosphodiester phosphodiesterase n=1 Tax=Nocardioides sp. SYSU DS0651 TaxID=3415955 RepID=UPI003F4B24CC
MRHPLRHTLLLLAGLGAAALTLAPPAAAAAVEGDQPEHVRVVNTAHRGASAYAPENTLAAFAVGIEQRSDWIESDVQLSKDGVPILMHDTTLARTTDVEQVFPGRAPWQVRDFTLAEIKQLDAGSWKGAAFAGEPVPTLAEMVEQVRRSRSGILMEIKAPHLYPGIERAVADVFAGFPGYVRSAVASGRLAVQSFDWGSMRTYAAIQPAVPVGLLGTPRVEELPALAAFAEQINPNHGTYDKAYVDAVHAAGMTVHTWTIDDPARMHVVLDRGVDGVITNRPDVLEQVLAERRLGAAA